MPVHVYICSKDEKAKLEKILAYDPYLDPEVIPKEGEKSATEAKPKIEELKEKDPYFDVIFARQEYQLVDGDTFSMDPSKCYLYLKANGDFLAKADEKLKKLLPGVERAGSKVEEKVISYIDELHSKAESGLGLIFGG